MKCPHCQSQKSIKNGKHHHLDGKAIRNYSCEVCGKRFSERTKNPMLRLRTPPNVRFISAKDENEGIGIRASGRVLQKSHVGINKMGEKIGEPVTAMESVCPPQVQMDSIERDEVYTRVGENLSPLRVKN